MKRLVRFTMGVLLVLMLAGVLWALESDVTQIPSCKYCGMNREMFAHSRMLITYEDGSSVGTCSLHCSILEFSLNLDKMPKSILVGDYGTKNLIDAEKAFWVIGGDKPGVMSKKAKWAFADKASAEKFQKEHGGMVAQYDEAVDEAYKSLKDDTQMIREKRKMMRMKKMEHK
jgi:copper chaperone NosL